MDELLDYTFVGGYYDGQRIEVDGREYVKLREPLDLETDFSNPSEVVNIQCKELVYKKQYMIYPSGGYYYYYVYIGD